MAWVSPKVDTARCARVLSRAVRIPTVSGGSYTPFSQLMKLLEESYPTLFSLSTVQNVDEDGVLIYIRGARNDQPFLLIGHLDVVPIDVASAHEWVHGPFSGDIADGCVWGRGTLDMKGHVITMLEAADSLLQTGWRPSREVCFALSFNEEIHGNGAHKMCHILKAMGFFPALLLDEGGGVSGEQAGRRRPIARVGVCEKGRALVTMTASGQVGLASRPGRQTAPEKLARAAAYLDTHRFPPRLCDTVARMYQVMAPCVSMPWRLFYRRPKLFWPLLLLEKNDNARVLTRTCITWTVARAGVQQSSLPSEAIFRYDCRILPGQTVDDIKKKFDRAVKHSRAKIKLTYEALAEPRRSSPVSGESWDALTTAISIRFPDAMVLPCLTGGNSDGRHYEEITRNIYHFSPFRLTAQERAAIHGVNEKLRVELLEDAIVFFQLLLQA